MTANGVVCWINHWTATARRVGHRCARGRMRAASAVRNPARPGPPVEEPGRETPVLSSPLRPRRCTIWRRVHDPSGHRRSSWGPSTGFASAVGRPLRTPAGGARSTTHHPPSTRRRLAPARLAPAWRPPSLRSRLRTWQRARGGASTPTARTVATSTCGRQPPAGAAPHSHGRPRRPATLTAWGAPCHSVLASW